VSPLVAVFAFSSLFLVKIRFGFKKKCNALKEEPEMVELQHKMRL